MLFIVSAKNIFSIGLCNPQYIDHTQSSNEACKLYSCKYFGQDPVFSDSREEIENIRGIQYSYQRVSVSRYHIYFYIN